MDKPVRFIDLFCGIGGIRIGMESQGFKCVFSCDINVECQKTYEENFGEKPQGDITRIDEKGIPDHEILCAGFPCQPFSISGKHKGFDDTRGTLFFEICRILEEKKPTIVFLENVKHLVHHDQGRTLRTIITKLKELGYSVSWRVLNGADFGVAQNRERIIIIGHLHGAEFDFDKIHTVKRKPLNDFLDTEGDFEFLDPSEYTLLDNPKQQPNSGLIFAGYRNKAIRKAGVRPGTEHLSRVHKQPNRIYSVRGIHPTLPSQESSGRFFILTEDNRVRKLTINECWRIMGFPEKYKKISAVGEQYKQLGNSVCVPMIQAVAKEIKKQFFEERKMTHSEVLNHVYDLALEKTANDDLSTDLPECVQGDIQLIVSRSETNKGISTVLMTLLTHKVVDPAQDIRNHQAQLPNGFAGRTIDQSYITPFMKTNNFPSMAESGWLTRSLEQAHPYDLSYPGKITPVQLKTAFLDIIDQVQCHGVDAKKVLLYYMELLIKQRDSLNIELAKPHALSISSIIKILEKHFTYHYSCSGASRLPTLAIYAAYQCMMGEVARYEGKELCPLESHNSADAQSGRIGDIDVNNIDGTAFEGVEVKHEIQITKQLVADAYEKFKIYNTDRYYLLTTATMDTANWDAIDAEIRRIAQIHGCQVIVNGVYSSLKYYLRLVKDPAEFIDHYVELLKSDETVKFPHRKAWNDIISEGV